MHELPRELAKSLRSWRGSVVRDSLDIERAEVEVEENDTHERGVKGLDKNNTTSSLILHPTKSTQGLHRNAPENVQRQQFDREYDEKLVRGIRQAIGRRGHDGEITIHESSVHQSGVLPRRQATFDIQTPASNKKSVFDQPKVADPDGAASRLDDDLNPLKAEDFYELMGMHPPKAKNVNPKKFAVTNGLYGKIQGSFDHLNTKYRVFDVLTYALLVIQLLLSAAFIVLGSISSGESHIAIAVLGAVSAIIAGGLALMKGQGLPNRLRQGRDSLHNVLFEAEELYWDVGAGRGVRFEDIKKLREDYLRVMEEMRRNHPDTWNAYSNGISGGIRPGRKQGVPSQSTPAPS